MLALVVGVNRLFTEALPGQDTWASLNSSLGFEARTFPAAQLIGSGAVAEDASLWMPRDARYRVLVGRKYKGTPWGWAAPHFLAGFLLPRKQTTSQSTRWVICIGCDVSSIGRPFKVLSDGGNGVLFGQVRR
jgi:hypothetical protein